MIPLGVLGLTLLLLGALGMWFFLGPDSDARPSMTDRAERLARFAPEQNPHAGRFYVPVEGRTAGHTAYLRYRVLGGQDSSVKDFRATYRIGGPGRVNAVIPREVADGLTSHVPSHADLAFTDLDGGVRRDVYVVYDGPGEGSPTESGARVYVLAQSP
ncbi:hypothetical protein HUT19_30980 [Streptomyces sp. NA02950]|uniref:hypothetical protein n=1 Tax=Streptomyces sp. NA02950 TaxID=2742137 RepID=UPI001590088A|nr:hypothetical protein [Streptomyces sp. NA02950]QKV95624.1 hypothetical protein HUT19_30980 [Streptomyces sp. NA02950]